MFSPSTCDTSKRCRRTFFAGVGLHELVLRTGFLEFWRQPCQLWEDFVNQSHFGREIVLVDVEGEEAADVACKESAYRSQQGYRRGSSDGNR